MIVMKAADVENAKVPSVNYKDKTLPVKGVGIRWLSKVGLDEQGVPEYGLRLFTVEPGGEIPVHSHFYMQTLYILSGRFDCRQFDPESETSKPQNASTPWGLPSGRKSRPVDYTGA